MNLFPNGLSSRDEKFPVNRRLSTTPTGRTLKRYRGLRALVPIALAAAGLASEASTSDGLPAPVITREPQHLSVTMGSAAELLVVASGTPPLTYQWQRDGTNIASARISTVAGNGTEAYSGEGRLAVESGMAPFGVAVDSMGRTMISDPKNHRIFRVETNGILAAVAGNGLPGYSGDGGSATNASLNEPMGIRVAADGSIYIADASNNRVRKVDANGVITTVAGTGAPSSLGDGGAAIQAGLNFPMDLALDSIGNLYIADTGNSRVRKVDPQGLITTVSAVNVANGVLRFGYVSSVAVDHLGNLLIVDENFGLIAEGPTAKIYKMDRQGVLSAFLGPRLTVDMGGGVTRSDILIGPSGLTVDLDGNVYVVDRDMGWILRVDPAGVVTSVAGDRSSNSGFSGDGGLAIRAALSRPFMAATDAEGGLYVSDSGNGRVRKVSLRGSPSLAISGDAAAAGDYRVIVSNTFGSVTSLVAKVTVTLPPLEVKVAEGLLTVRGTNSPGITQVLESSRGMDSTMEWTPVQTNTVTAPGPWTYTEIGTPNLGARFFRLSSR